MIFHVSQGKDANPFFPHEYSYCYQILICPLGFFQYA